MTKEKLLNKEYPSQKLREVNNAKLNLLTDTVFSGIGKEKVLNLILSYMLERKDDILISIYDNKMTLIEKKDRE
jgi:histidinol-phosphate/aromatic aminotransferase/cobyric acid decarboxylase-like protein